MNGRCRLLLALVAAACGAGCDMARFAAKSTVGVIQRGSPALGRFEDADLAEEAIPGSIGTMEAVLEVRPEDTTLRALIARTYASYGFGFLEDRMERALALDDETAAEAYRSRASMAFLRAKDVAIGALSYFEDDDGGAQGHFERGLPAWTAYLDLFDDPEEHASALFWGAYAWARYIGLHRDDVNALADLPYVNAMADRVLALDGAFMGHAPHALRAGLVGSTPAQFGGRPDEARREFEAAIAATERKNLMYIVLEARIVAVAIQDRALYRRLLEEALNASVDVDPDIRLTNVLAKRRAERYLAEIDRLFEPEGTPAGSEASPEAPAAPTP